jgi:sorting nexin-27
LQEAERLEPSEDPISYNYIDYSEKRSLPISIPDYHNLDRKGERFVVRNLTELCKKNAIKLLLGFQHLHGRSTFVLSEVSRVLATPRKPEKRLCRIHVSQATWKVAVHVSLVKLIPNQKLNMFHKCRLSEQQLDSRRRGLEQYLEKVCAVRVIAESEVMQEFLTDADEDHVKDCFQFTRWDSKMLLSTGKSFPY